MKSAVSPLVARFVCFNLAVTFSTINLLNSQVVIYIYIYIYIYMCVCVCVCILWSGNIFSTVVRAVLVTKLVILGN